MPSLDLKEKRNKKKQMPSYNDGHNIMKIFYVSLNFPFTTSEMKPNYQ